MQEKLINRQRIRKLYNFHLRKHSNWHITKTKQSNEHSSEKLSHQSLKSLILESILTGIFKNNHDLAISNPIKIRTQRLCSKINISQVNHVGIISGSIHQCFTSSPNRRRYNPFSRNRPDQAALVSMTLSCSTAVRGTAVCLAWVDGPISFQLQTYYLHIAGSNS